MHVKREVPILSVAEATRLLEAARSTCYYALFVLALTLGAREGELFALKWGAVDLDQRFVYIRSTLTMNEQGCLLATAPKTNASVRRVPLSTQAVAALKDLRDLAGDSALDGSFVFRAPDGGAIRRGNFVRRVFHPLLETAKLPRITFHSLRHVCASLLLASGQNVKVIQGLLGHASSRLTLDVYTHIAPEELGAAARAMDDILSVSARTEGIVEGTSQASPVLPAIDKTRNPLQITDSMKPGRSRDRTYDLSRVKRALYR
jgi:integrase